MTSLPYCVPKAINAPPLCLRSSSLPIAARCTSSGPSAKRSVRACAQASARPAPASTPAAPCAWMARIDDLERHIGRDHLDHGDLGARRLVAHRVHHMRRLEHQQPWPARSRCATWRCPRTMVPCSAIGLPKATRDLTRAHHRLERAFGDADQPHAVVDAPRAEPTLGDFEAAALAEDQVRGRHADVGEVDLPVAVRRVVVAIDRERSEPARRRACRSAPGSSTAACGARPPGRSCP